jgi:hypothetical protein
MRKIIALSLLLASSLAFAKVEDGLAIELQHQRALILHVIQYFLTDQDSTRWMILMRESPNAELSEGVTDLVHGNSRLMREITLDQFLRDLALHGGLTYMRGHNLSESGVTLPAMKEAFRLYLRGLKTDVMTTVLTVNMDDLRLSNQPSPEYQLIFSHMITMLRQENINNFRLIVVAKPKTWNYVFATRELAMPIWSLDAQERLQVIDGGKLEILPSCASVVGQTH